MSKQLLASGTYEGEAWECYRESGRLFWKLGDRSRIDLCESRAVLALLQELNKADAASRAVQVALDSLTKERDEARAALWESLALNRNVFADAEPEMLSYYSEHRAVIAQAQAALSGASQAQGAEG